MATTAARRQMYSVRIEENVMIPTRDGTRLAATLFWPIGDGPFPAVMQYAPYRKDDRTVPGWDALIYFAERGYVGVRLDVRGTGDSEGVAEDEYCLTEQLDGYDVIEWLAAQPWSNGNVGMFGTSYSGFNSIQVAMHRPPHLKAIVPMYATDNRYTDDFHHDGGALRAFYWGDYPLRMVAMNALPPYPHIAGGRWADVWHERLEGSQPWMVRWLSELLDGPQWQNGSLDQNYASITAATFIIGGWRDGYPDPPLRMMQHLQCPKRAVVGPWTHARPDKCHPGPRVDYLHEMLRWWDQWLLGIDTGVTREPAIAYYLQRYDTPDVYPDLASGEWRYLDRWPDPAADRQTRFLSAGGRLTSAPSEAATEEVGYKVTVGQAGGFWCPSSLPYGLPADQRVDEAYSLVYTSEPLEEDLSTLGFASAQLRLSGTAPIANVVVKVADVAPDGGSALVTRGVLNLTHRNGHTNPEPLEPNSVYDVVVPLRATAWQWQRGHRIRIALSASDWPNIWPSPLPHTLTFHLGGEGCRIVLPIITNDYVGDRPAFLAPTPITPAPVEQINQPAGWDWHHNVATGTITVLAETSHELRLHNGTTRFFTHLRVETTANDRDPAVAGNKGWVNYRIVRDELDVDVTAHSVVQSSRDHLQIVVTLNVKLDGEKQFQRHWMRTIPRLGV